MKKISLIISLTISTFLIASCSQEPEATKPSATPAPPVAPAPAPAPATQPNPSPEKNTTLPQVTGLIPATKGDVQLARIKEGRPDPFGLMDFGKLESNAQSTTPPVTPSNNNIGKKGTKLPPQPDLAREVTVSGIIQFGDVTNVILKAPNEKNFRYVQIGQYIANGQVLVKKVDLSQGNSIVVLEQLGMEVRKVVKDDI